MEFHIDPQVRQLEGLQDKVGDPSQVSWAVQLPIHFLPSCANELALVGLRSNSELCMLQLNFLRRSTLGFRKYFRRKNGDNSREKRRQKGLNHGEKYEEEIEKKLEKKYGRF
jgi:hypothetical protein